MHITLSKRRLKSQKFGYPTKSTLLNNNAESTLPVLGVFVEMQLIRLIILISALSQQRHHKPVKCFQHYCSEGSIGGVAEFLTLKSPF